MKSFCVLLLLCSVPVFGFLNYHIWKWSDCSDPNTRVIEITNFDVSPKPLYYPGNATVTILGNIAHQVTFNSKYRLNVTIDKNFLGHWHAFPCVKGFGTCVYEDPCDFIHVILFNSTSPIVFTSSGQFTCPFTFDNINVRSTVIPLKIISEEYSSIFTGDFRVRLELLDRTSMIGCLAAEFTMLTRCTGFLCGK